MKHSKFKYFREHVFFPRQFDFNNLSIPKSSLAVITAEKNSSKDLRKICKTEVKATPVPDKRSNRTEKWSWGAELSSIVQLSANL